MGKRQVGELEPSELVLALIISDLAAVPMQESGIPLLAGIVPIITLLCVTMIFSVLTMKSIRFRAAICGSPSIIVKDGIPVQREMRKSRYTIDELMEELRAQGVTDLASIKYAVLETNGRLSVILRPEQQPITPATLEKAAEDSGLPTILISDGRLMKENLRFRGLDERWIKEILKRYDVSSRKQVFLLMIDDTGKLYFAKQEGAEVCGD